MRTDFGFISPVRAMLGRDLSSWRRILPGYAAFTLIFGLLCWAAALSLTHGAESGYLAAPVAVVVDESSEASRFAVRLIAAQDFASPLSLVRCSEEEAKDGLADGTFCAAVYLPESYIDSVLTGEQVQARVILSENAELHAGVVRLLAQFGEELLATGQFGVFAGEQLVLRQAPEQYEAFMTEVNLLYLRQAITGRWFVRTEAAYGGTGITAAQWYGVLFAALFFQLAGMVYLPLRSDLTTPTIRRLRSMGVGSFAFVSTKVLLMVLGSLLTVLIATAAAGALDLSAGLLPGIFGLLMTALVSLALLFCLPRSGSAGMITALAALGLFCAGGIVPRMELPGMVTRAAELLPLTVTARMFSAVLGAGVPAFSWLAGLCWCAAAALAIRLRMNQVCRGVPE